MPTGDAEIDHVIEDRLAFASGGGRATTVLGTVIMVAVFGVPIVAAVRANTWWWLAAYAVLPVFVAAFPTESFTDPPSARLDRFRSALSRSKGNRPITAN